MSRRILVGISTYNDYEYLDMLLQSIRWYTYTDEEKFDLVVCDDGTRYRFSRPGADGVTQLDAQSVATADRAAQVAARYGAVWIENSSNQGIPATWNHLANALGGESEIIVLLNNDLLMVPNWLRVIVHFLGANKDNPHVGSCYWNPVNGVPKTLMREILPQLGHTLFVAKDQITGRERDFFGSAHTEVRLGENQGLGRVMCPCGCCFAFRREIFNAVGGFVEELTSFHEESLTAERYITYRDSVGDVHIDTIEQTFKRYEHTLRVDGDKEFVFPNDAHALSGEINLSAVSVLNHHVTDAEFGALLRSKRDGGAALELREKLSAWRAETKLASGLHINTGVWDRINYIVRHRTDKPIVDVRSKFGATRCTEDHSLIIRDGDELVGAKPRELDGKSLERVWEFPVVEEIGQVDLAEYVEGVPGIQYDERHIWYAGNNVGRLLPKEKAKATVNRIIETGTPEMDALCELIGMHVSEGSVCIHQRAKEKGGGASCTTVLVCGNDIRVSERALQLFPWIANASARIQRSPKKGGYKDVYAAVCSHRVVAEIFRGLCGQKSRTKRLPRFVFRLPREHQTQVWNAMLAGDGFRPKSMNRHHCTRNALDNYFLYTTNSRGLVADISVLLCQFGEKYTIGYRKSADAYWIRNTLKAYNNRFVEPIVTAASSSESEYVYDLETENTHRFTDAEGLILVHNSMFGSSCAKQGRASFGFAYPRPYHTHGYTFGANPELEHSRRMAASRKMYRLAWGVPESIPDTSYFEWVHNQLMPQIPLTRLKFLAPDYSLPLEIHKLPGGEMVSLPALVEREGEF